MYLPAVPLVVSGAAPEGDVGRIGFRNRHSRGGPTEWNVF
jgi:hypothetical protein